MSFSCILAEAKPTDPSNIAAMISIAVVVITIYAVRKSRKGRSAAKPKRGQAKSAPKPFVYPTHPVIEGPEEQYSAPADGQLDSIRQLMGPAPRAFDEALECYLAVVPPKWLDAAPADEQWLNVKNQDRLRRDGPVVWATIVQANNILFKRVNGESGASVIYSPDPWFDRHREALGEIAQQCFSLKGTDPSDPESAAFARMLTNELTRGMRLRVPRAFTGGRKVYHSSMLLPRKHLPKGFLSGGYFPVWMDLQKTGAVVMVPAAYWPASLTMEWDRERN